MSIIVAPADPQKREAPGGGGAVPFAFARDGRAQHRESGTWDGSRENCDCLAADGAERLDANFAASSDLAPSHTHSPTHVLAKLWSIRRFSAWPNGPKSRSDSTWIAYLLSKLLHRANRGGKREGRSFVGKALMPFRNVPFEFLICCAASIPRPFISLELLIQGGYFRLFRPGTLQI